MVDFPVPIPRTRHVDKDGGKGSKYTPVSKMSHEFQVHHLLNELVSLLHVKGADVDIDSYADVLLKNRTPYVTTQVALQHFNDMPLTPQKG